MTPFLTDRIIGFHLWLLNILGSALASPATTFTHIVLADARENQMR